jgi:hypothetical protein
MMIKTSAISFTVFVESGGVMAFEPFAREVKDAIIAKKRIQIDFIV